MARDLQTKKLNAIEYIEGLEDESILNKIELAILGNKVRTKRKLKSFTKKQLLERAGKSKRDYKTDKYKTQEALEKESDSW